ncbi:MAG: HDOD domain-containing protein [Desulfarculales bacterium]|jgi:HD-like signal output (HDOD) protein|nr:HDOD domain-containing protein [Desulfarculales bacterium]
MQARGQQFISRTLRENSLPQLSSLTMKIISLSSFEDIKPRDLLSVAEADPALAAHVLNLVNSSLYRQGGEPISDLSHAAAKLGAREICLLALSLSICASLPVNEKNKGMNYSSFWGMSVQRAVMAKELAGMLYYSSPEEAFAAGLLLDIGLIIMLRALPVTDVRKFPGLQMPSPYRLNWEELHYGCNHRQMGAAIVMHWGLPRFLAECMLANGDGLLNKIIEFSAFTTESYAMPDSSFIDIHEKGRQLLNLDSDQINQIITESLFIDSQVAATLTLEADQQDMLQLVGKAGQTLSDLFNAAQPCLKEVMQSIQDSRKQNDMSLQQQAVRNTLEAVMHEIRNPLMSVGGFAKRLMSQDDSEGSAQRYAKVIMDEASRLDNVLGQVSSLLSQVNPKMRPVDIRLLLESLRQKMNIGQARIALSWRIGNKKGFMIESDPNLLEESLSLIIDYIRQRAGKNPSCVISLKYDQRQVTVSMNAPGVPKINPAAMHDLAFGPELSLLRAHRILEAMGSSVESEATPEGCMINLEFELIKEF